MDAMKAEVPTSIVVSTFLPDDVSWVPVKFPISSFDFQQLNRSGPRGLALTSSRWSIWTDACRSVTIIVHILSRVNGFPSAHMVGSIREGGPNDLQIYILISFPNLYHGAKLLHVMISTRCTCTCQKVSSKVGQRKFRKTAKYLKKTANCTSRRRTSSESAIMSGVQKMIKHGEELDEHLTGLVVSPPLPFPPSSRLNSNLVDWTPSPFSRLGAMITF